MLSRIDTIEGVFSSFKGVVIISRFIERDNMICGCISLTEENVTLKFDVEIFTYYPYQFHSQESIRFINKELINCNHINEDGSVCVHTLHHPKLSDKLLLDLNGLRHWIIKYYIGKESDTHYEHIVVNHKAIEGQLDVFLFTDIDFDIKSGMYGRFTFSQLQMGKHKEEAFSTLLIKTFNINGQKVKCKWSNIYHHMVEAGEGIFYFDNSPPVVNGRFAVKNFKQLEKYFSQSFLGQLKKLCSDIVKKWNCNYIPLLLGYRLPTSEIHWQAIMIENDHFPNYGEKISGSNSWIGRLKDQEILWVQTRNCSYSYFFGRGAFNKKITDARVLVIGVGAIGSQLATTLVRGGLKHLCIVDYDVKEPENVCRSEYMFLTGFTDKIHELKNRLIGISPFVEVEAKEDVTDLLKWVINASNSEWKSDLRDYFESFDIIFDCSTDNDIAFLLDDFNLRSEIFSISVTNHARELVCATKNNLYSWIADIYQRLDKGSEDFYNPTGCWNSTFKASYTDISVLIQFALRQINLYYENSQPSRHFYLSTSNDSGFNIKLNQF